ncbi:pentatricopeptide repeat-containing protein, mitochondrial [Iris pallida]|uniref:Pentatricopeptide repeat-containing protein, mitochondrial n=1 Tax=Iris pallida TaxID=29817 RepID=A0AAX6DNK0_IRIPA|nr:pentatricopeptide repeat-containing protein, mitochondrial [Iris pallida]
MQGQRGRLHRAGRRVRQVRQRGAAMAVFGRMKCEGFEPDKVTYGVVVRCLCKAGKLDRATKWFEFCVSNGVAINAVFYTSLIDGFSRRPGCIARRRDCSRRCSRRASLLW